MKPQRMNSSPLPPDPGMSRGARGGLTAAALVLVPLLAIVGGDAFRALLDFAAGVLSLVSLTWAVIWGLLATDRLFLSSRNRLLAQAVHRATAVASLGFLLLHITVKVSLGHVALIGALVPFGLGVSGTNGLIGLGSLAGFLMIIAAVTGALRSAFATPGRVTGLWRMLHMGAYPAWCFALMHGLYTGRPAAAWVTTMYCLSLCGVAAAVSMRLLPAHVQRRIADRVTGRQGPARAVPDPEGARRDLLQDPLPGVAGLAAQARSWDSQAGQQFRSAPGFPAGPTAQTLGQRTPPVLTAPAPQPYGALTGDPLSAGDPLARTGTDAFGRPHPGPGAPGTGIAGGYRAVSAAADGRIPPPAPPFPGAGAGPSDSRNGEISFAQRVPMTEELPVITDLPPGRPGSWPAPAPAPPGQAAAPAAYDTGALPTYDTGSLPAYDTGAIPTYGPHSASPYDTGAQPAYDTGAQPAYGTGPVPAYDTGAHPGYGTGQGPAYDGTAYPGGTYDNGAVPPYDGRASSPAQPMPDEPAPGHPYPPQAGEPWHAPAGDRP